MEWVYAFASSAGTSHIKEGLSCQDNCICEVVKGREDGGILIAIASDGAGSSEYGDMGSRLICNILKEEITGFFERGFSLGDITRETAAGWIEKFRYEVSFIAGDRGRSMRDYACTLVGAVVGALGGVYFQIGDGAIVVLPKDSPAGYRCIFWPQRGEYANTTFFATDKYALDRNLRFKRSISKEDEIINIVLFTDGIQHLVLHYESRTPYAGFFKPLFKALNSLSDKGTEEINSLLEKFLSSEKINNRTDDDKTLIIAARHTGGDMNDVL